MPLKYRAFISYSHQDSRLARRIHARLESWSIDTGLVGRETSVGTVPDSLAPIFLDRDELAGGGELSQVILEALEHSECLIVLCSPAAARSHYVNDEIRQFRQLGRAHRIHPIILEGEPGDASAPCFPPALVTDDRTANEKEARRLEPVAADIRDQGDGMTRALAKTVAGMLGVPFDDIVRRAEQRERRRQRILRATTGFMAILAVTAAGFGWLSETRRQVAQHNYEAAISAADALVGNIGHTLANVEGIPLDTTRRVFDKANDIYDTLGAALPDEPSLMLSRIASMMEFAAALSLKGDNRGQLELLTQAESRAVALNARADAPASARTLMAMLRWRLATALASDMRFDEALERLRLSLDDLPEGNLDSRKEALIRLERLTAESMQAMLLARLGRHQASGDAADALITRATALGRQFADDEDLSLAANALRLGAATLFESEGDNTRAIDALEHMEQDLGAVLDKHPDQLAVRTAMVQIQRSLTDLYTKNRQPEAAEQARQRHREALAAIATRDKENLQRQAQLALSELDAVESGRAADDGSFDMTRITAIRQRLDAAMAGMSPQNPSYDLYLYGLARLVSLLWDAGQIATASDIADRLVTLDEARLKEDPASADRINMLSLAVRQQARLHDHAGRYADALAGYEHLLDLEARLADTGRDMRQRLAQSLDLAGTAAWRLGDRDRATGYYTRQGALLDELLGETPDDTSLLASAGQLYIALGEIQAMRGERAAAFESFQRSLQWRERLDAISTEDPGMLVDLAWSETRLAEFGDQSTQRWQRVITLLEQANRLSPLDDLAEALYASARIQAGTGPTGKSNLPVK